MTSSTPSSTNSYEQHPDVVWGPSPKLPSNLPDDLAEARLPATGKKIPRSDLETCECSKCGEFKAPAEFYKKNRLETKGTCKRCWAAYMAERRKAQPQVPDVKAQMEALENELAEVKDECEQLRASNTELHERYNSMDEKFSAFIAGMVAQANHAQLGKPQAPEVKIAVEPAKPSPPPALTTADLRAALKQSRENPSTPVKMDSYYLLGGTPCAYGMNRSVTTDVDHIKPYTTEFEPTWKQMRKEDKLAQIEADKDNPLADLM